MAVARLRKELLAIDKEELGSNWTDKVQAVASAAEAAALMESGAVPIVAQMIQTKTDAEPPSWTWSTGPTSDDKFFKWSATLCMAGATPFADGRFELSIDIPEDYPFKPPFFSFKTKVHHPGVSPEGKICLAELQLKENGGTWDPSKTIPGILDCIGGMLAFPESILGHPLRAELAGQLRDEKESFIKAAKKCTDDHAM